MGVSTAVVMQADPNRPSPLPYTPPQRLWPATPNGVHKARHKLVTMLAEWGLSELAEDAGLVLSELMTNAQRHARVPGRQIGTNFYPVSAGIVVEVHDASAERPTPVQAGDADEQGRGLAIVEAVTDGQWGVTDREGPGKVVWAAILSVAALLSMYGRAD